MSNPSEARCPRCAAPLPPNAPEGLCPRCLGALNLATETVPTGADAPPASPQPPLTPGELAPHFPQLEILECLGRGGMGVVYKARQKTLNRVVALKLLAPERVTDAGFAERFTREAQALARLNHPNIVTIHDFGCTRAGAQPETPNCKPETSFYFLLMEFVDGVNLRQAMKAGRFTPEQALAIVPPVCEALQYAHEQGIVHRDIKPENLLLDKAGRIKIADFGIAKMLGNDGARLWSETQPQHAGEPSPAAAGPADTAALQQTAAGTPQYMAPEQRTAPQRTDHRADIYSLGVVLYELLTGELPGAKLQPPSRKVQIDVRLDEIVLRALETKPELRYATAAEFRTQVENVTGAAAAGRHETVWQAQCRTCGQTRPLARVLGIQLSASHRERRMFIWCPKCRWPRLAEVVAHTVTPAPAQPASRDGGQWLAPAISLVLFFAGLVVGIPFINALPVHKDSGYLALAAFMFCLAAVVGFLAASSVQQLRSSPEASANASARAWLKGLGWLAFVLAVPVIGFGLFFLLQVLVQPVTTAGGGGWNPTPSEALFVPLTWFGSLLLPLAGLTLLRMAALVPVPATVQAQRSGRSAVALLLTAVAAFGLALLVGFLVLAGLYRSREATMMAQRAALAAKQQAHDALGTQDPSIAAPQTNAAATNATAMDFRVLKVEAPPGLRDIRVHFQCTAPAGFGFEVCQDVTRGPYGEAPKSKDAFWLRTKWVGLNDPPVLVWTLPEDFTPAEVQAGAKQVEAHLRTMRDALRMLPTEAVSSFGKVRHREGWLYELVLRVKSARDHSPVQAADAWVVEGTVRDGEGKPVPEADIHVSSGAGSLFVTGKGKTGADGTYRVGFGPGISMSAGDRRGAMQAAIVHVGKPGFEEKELGTGGNLQMAWELTPQQLAGGWQPGPQKTFLPGRPLRVDFVLLPAATVRGTLLAPDGKPLPNRTIVLVGDRLRPASSIYASAKTDADGRFTFKDVSTQHAWSFSIEKTPHHRKRTAPDRFAEARVHEVTLIAEGDDLRRSGVPHAAATPPTYRQFDQTPGQGWRALADAGKFTEAAALIRDYLRRAPALPARDRANLHFHAAQCFALDGQPGSLPSALAHLQDAQVNPEPPDFIMRWNDYVAATGAFLKRDLSALKAARERIAAGPKFNGEPLNLDVVDRLIANFGKPYAEAYRAPAAVHVATTEGKYDLASGATLVITAKLPPRGKGPKHFDGRLDWPKSATNPKAESFDVALSEGAPFAVGWRADGQILWVACGGGDGTDNSIRYVRKLTIAGPGNVDEQSWDAREKGDFGGLPAELRRVFDTFIAPATNAPLK